MTSNNMAPSNESKDPALSPSQTHERVLGASPLFSMTSEKESELSHLRNMTKTSLEQPTTQKHVNLLTEVVQEEEPGYTPVRNDK